MAKKLPGEDNVFSLFDDRSDEIPDLDIETPQGAVQQPVPDAGAAVDLTGKPKILMAFGAGNSGKSTYFRWVCDRPRPPGVVLATADVGRPTLHRFYPDAMKPGSAEGAMVWLEKLLSRLIETQRTALIDFPADTSLVPLLTQLPDLQKMMTDGGVEPVVLYLLTPRAADLTILASMEKAGFRPTATALVLNTGVMATDEAAREFSAVRRHAIYKEVLARGAVEVWMPKLFAAKSVEDRGLGFRQSLNYRSEDGNVPPLALFDKSRVAAWLNMMERHMSPIMSWMP